MSKITHTHTDSEGRIITHTHDVDDKPAHGHYHSPEEKTRQINRLAKAAGHLQHVKGMIENDEDCADVLIQLSAVISALQNLGKEIINEHITHCIAHAVEDGDMTAVESFRKAISRFL
jgi:DNA-binding FrmR family transcriptional regulator